MRVNEMKFSGQRHTATYETSGTVETGDAVVMTAAGVIARGAGNPIGIVTAVEDDGHATVLLYGEIITAKAAAALTPGYGLVVANTDGQLAAGTTDGRPAIVHAATATEAAVTLL